MTEKSWFWRGLVVGDAILAKYNAATIVEIWRKLFTTDSSEEGVIAGVDNELEPSYTATKSKVDTGAALVDGGFYTNDALIEESGFGGASESQRYWRNVLRRSPSIHYVRTSVSGPGDTSYPAFTQIEDEVWEIPISKYLSDAGSLTGLTDERVFAKSPLCQFINFRQGGSTADWALTGSDKMMPGMPKIFAGTRKSDVSTGICDVSFPVEFLSPPIILTTCHKSTPVFLRVAIASITTMGWWGYTRTGDNSIINNIRVSWLAIGPVA